MAASDPRDAGMLRLLALMVVLQGMLLVGGLSVTAWGLMQLARAESRLHVQRQAVEQQVALTRSWLGVARARQEAMARELARAHQQTRRQVESLQSRRSRLDGVPGNPLAKVDRGLLLTQLMADQQMVLLHDLVRTQDLLARALSPWPPLEPRP